MKKFLATPDFDSRGQVVVEGEKFYGKPGQGSFLKRAVYRGV
jgi:hypothetical protein